MRRRKSRRKKKKKKKKKPRLAFTLFIEIIHYQYFFIARGFIVLVHILRRAAVALLGFFQVLW